MKSRLGVAQAESYFFSALRLLRFFGMEMPDAIVLGNVVIILVDLVLLTWVDLVSIDT